MQFMNDITQLQNPEDGIPASIASIISLIVAGIAKAGINKATSRKEEKKEYQPVLVSKESTTKSRRRQGLFTTRIAMIRNIDSNNTSTKIKIGQKEYSTLIDTEAGSTLITEEMYNTITDKSERNKMLTNETLFTLNEAPIKLLAQVEIKMYNK